MNPGMILNNQSQTSLQKSTTSRRSLTQPSRYSSLYPRSKIFNVNFSEARPLLMFKFDSNASFAEMPNTLSKLPWNLQANLADETFVEQFGSGTKQTSKQLSSLQKQSIERRILKEFFAMTKFLQIFKRLCTGHALSYRSIDLLYIIEPHNYRNSHKAITGKKSKRKTDRQWNIYQSWIYNQCTQEESSKIQILAVQVLKSENNMRIETKIEVIQTEVEPTWQNLLHWHNSWMPKYHEVTIHELIWHWRSAKAMGPCWMVSWIMEVMPLRPHHGVRKYWRKRYPHNWIKIGYYHISRECEALIKGKRLASRSAKLAHPAKKSKTWSNGRRCMAWQTGKSAAQHYSIVKTRKICSLNHKSLNFSCNERITKPWSRREIAKCFNFESIGSAGLKLGNIGKARLSVSVTFSISKQLYNEFTYFTNKRNENEVRILRKEFLKLLLDAQN